MWEVQESVMREENVVGGVEVGEGRRNSYRLFRSTSAFLQTKLEYRRPTPLIFVKAYITFCLPVPIVKRLLYDFCKS